ncbi:MAG: biotin/lipoyl-binding protein, partial [Chloroflexi bacterium]|nr:biotin/lipoyl-binding protein [Chloroflexota bacterium]
MALGITSLLAMLLILTALFTRRWSVIGAATLAVAVACQQLVEFGYFRELTEIQDSLGGYQQAYSWTGMAVGTWIWLASQLPIQRRWSWIGMTLIIAVAIVAGALLLASIQLPLTMAIIKGTLEDAVTATGVLEASQYVDIGTQVSGILKKIAVQIGQTVQKGDLLAQIDPTLFRAQVIQEQANLKDLNARLVSAEATL